MRENPVSLFLDRIGTQTEYGRRIILALISFHGLRHYIGNFLLHRWARTLYLVGNSFLTRLIQASTLALVLSIVNTAFKLSLYVIVALISD